MKILGMVISNLAEIFIETVRSCRPAFKANNKNKGNNCSRNQFIDELDRLDIPMDSVVQLGDESHAALDPVTGRSMASR